MKDKDVKAVDYFLVSFGTLFGLVMTIASAIVCGGTWKTFWIIASVISVICYGFAWFLNYTIKDGFGQLVVYMFYSFVMFFAGCGTAFFTWGGNSWILILLIPFEMLGLGLAPFAIIGIILATVNGMGDYFWEHKKK